MNEHSSNRFEVLGRPSIPPVGQILVVASTFVPLAILTYFISLASVTAPHGRVDLWVTIMAWLVYLLALSSILVGGSFKPYLIADPHGLTYRTDLFPIRPIVVPWSKIGDVNLTYEERFNKTYPLLTITDTQRSRRVVRIRRSRVGEAEFRESLRQAMPVEIPLT